MNGGGESSVCPACPGWNLSECLILGLVLSGGIVRVHLEPIREGSEGTGYPGLRKSWRKGGAQLVKGLRGPRSLFSSLQGAVGTQVRPTPSG